jgi:hypothetical protein
MKKTHFPGSTQTARARAQRADAKQEAELTVASLLYYLHGRA